MPPLHDLATGSSNRHHRHTTCPRGALPAGPLLRGRSNRPWTRWRGAVPRREKAASARSSNHRCSPPVNLWRRCQLGGSDDNRRPPMLLLQGSRHLLPHAPPPPPSSPMRGKPSPSPAQMPSRREEMQFCISSLLRRHFASGFASSVGDLPGHAQSRSRGKIANALSC
jgi:hypothetical protein